MLNLLTFDQGNEFLRYDWISKMLEVNIYFCDPASPHQKGGIENANSLLRVHLPRKTDISLISQRKIDALVRNINNRPMECLNYCTSAEVFNEES